MVLMLAAWRDMFIDVMDFDPRITSEGHGWGCNFHLGHGHDVILEDAINEKSCVQALQCLIAKADTEIHELEDELAILQCQLKWAESDKLGDPYEVCCATFKQKINYLTESIQDLKNKRILNEHEMDKTLNNPMPAERIYDIINTLTKQNFSAPEKQVENSSNEMNLRFNSCSVDMGTVLKQKETTLESSAESRELTEDLERQCKPDTVSEESCSDVARIAMKDLFEDRVLGKTDVEMIKKAEVYANDCTPERRNIFTTCVQADNNEGNSKSNALRHEEVEDCLIESRISGSGSSPSCAKLETNTEMIVKVEVDDSDISIQNVAADFLCMRQDQESRSLFEGQLEVKENQSPSTHDTEITYGSYRKRSSLSAVIKPQGPKVQKKIPNGPKQSNPMMLKPQGKIGKRNFPSNGNKLRQPNSPSLKADVTFGTLAEKIVQSKSVDTTLSERNISEEDDLSVPKNLALVSHNELVVCPESTLSGEGKSSLLHSSSVNLHNVSSKNTNLDSVVPKESQAYDLESLRLKVSQQPDFLYKMKIPELKVIAKVNNIKGLSKLKKEKMIEELTKLLNTA